MNKQRIKLVVSKQPYFSYISPDDLLQVEDGVSEVQFPAYFENGRLFATTIIRKADGKWIKDINWTESAKPEEWDLKNHSVIYPSTEKLIKDIRRSYSVIGREAVIVLKDTSSFTLKRVRKYTRK